MRKAVAVIVLTCASVGGSHTLGAQAVWAVDSVPLTHVPGSAPNGDVLFEGAAGVTRLGNGTIVIAEPTAGSIRFFDASGRPVRTVGRRGTGPGEFRAISWLGQCARDTVSVWDFMQQRMTVLSPEGDVVRQYQIPSSPKGGPTPARLSCTQAGGFVLIGQSGDLPPNAPKPFGTHKVPLVLSDDRGNVQRSLGSVPGHEYAFQANGNLLPRPLGRVTSVALAPDRVYVGTADSAGVDVYALDGRPLPSLRVGATKRPATKAHYDRAVDDLVAYMPDRNIRERMKTGFLTIPMPKELLPYSALFVDPDKLLWAVLSVKGDTDTRLQVVHPDGRMVATVRIPAALTIFEIGRDYILGSYDDADGEPHVAAYRLRRSSVSR